MLDTNILSALIHQRRDFERVATRIDTLPLEDRLVSAITQSEIETMIAKAGDPPKKAAQARLVLAYFNVQDFGEGAAYYTGQIRAYLEPKGISIGPLDTLIAAHAMSLEAVIVTGNVSEFSRVPGLKVENWLR
ncbi:MAG: PIN domain-containing protein [Burkholderiales bacterium]